MKLIFTLAWRNIWRNRRRTLISIGSVFFAVVFALFMRATQLGSYELMIANTVEQYTGYLQIHESGYKEKESIDLSFIYSNEIRGQIKSNANVKELVPRLESFVLISTSHDTKGSLIMGIDPDAENRMNALQKRLIAGDYLDYADQAVMLAEGLAQNLKLSVGDTVVLISQGFHGVSAAAKYPIKGLIKYAIPEQNNSLMFLSLKEAQHFFAADERIT
ncbi:MAG: ABC transporter permease, partial [Calditrichaeota bacterium]|nr:ABC transporter permease [Calditrichota bacterium]